MKYQAPHAPVCVQDQDRIVWIDRKLPAEGTKSVVTVDDDVSQSRGEGEADDTNPAMSSLAQPLCQGWNWLVSEPASTQIHSPIGMNGVADRSLHHRPSRHLGVVDEVTQDVPDPPAAAPGRRIPLLRGEGVKGIRHSAAIVGDPGLDGGSLVVRSVRGHAPILTPCSTRRTSGDSRRVGDLEDVSNGSRTMESDGRHSG